MAAPAGGPTTSYRKRALRSPLHHVFVDSDAACERINEIIDGLPTFAEGHVDTIGQAHSTTQVVDLVKPGADVGASEWKIGGHTNPVRLRWLANTSIRSRSSRTLAVVDLNDPKFDVLVQVQSNADKLAEKLAAEVVEAFYQHSDLVYESNKPFVFGPLRISKKRPDVHKRTLRAVFGTE